MLHYENLELSNIVYFCEFDLIEKIEQWKDVVGYEELYQVSDLGRVKSLKRITKHSYGGLKRLPCKIMSIQKGKHYFNVKLCKQGKSKTNNISVLVASAFLNHIPCGYKEVVDHKDNNPLNNKVSNLQIITSRLNSSKDKNNKISKYTGVKQNTANKNKWESHMRINRIKIFLGVFENEILASEFYKKAVENIEKYNGVPKDFRELIKGLMD